MKAKSMPQSQEPISYKSAFTQFIGSGAGWAALVVSVGWIAWQVHASQPHLGAVTETMLATHVEHLREVISKNHILYQLQFQNVDKKLDSLLRQQEKLDSLLRQIENRKQ